MKFLGILKKFIIPLLVIIIVFIMALDLNTITLNEMIDKMEESNVNGILTGTEFINEKIGISFETPEIDNIPWKIVPYKQQFTQRPNLYTAAETEFLAMEKDNYWVYFILRARLKDIPYSRLKNETTEDYGKRIRNKYVSQTASRYRSEYWDRFIISDAMLVTINGNQYSKYSSHDIELDDYHSCYTLVKNGWGYKFYFYGWGEPIDQNYVNSILYSIEFTEPTVVFERD